MRMQTLRRIGAVLLMSAVPVLGISAQAESENTMQLAADNTTFAIDLFHQLQAVGEQNLVFSPYSVSQALAMTYAGARGETEAQMADALAFGLPQPALHEAFSALNAALTERGNGAAKPDRGLAARTLRIANTLWGEQTYPFSSEYQNQLAQYYGAGLQLTDFVNAPEAARQQINDWVAEQTEDRIENIVPPNAISPETRLVLANAVYFYGGWRYPFVEGATQDRDFHLLDGTTISVPTMGLHEDLTYLQGDGYQAIEFPYAASRLTFTVIMPDEGTFADFSERFDAEMLGSIVNDLAWTDVVVFFPQFEFDFGVGLAETLEAMGMTDAFSPTDADFSGMIGSSSALPLYISDVLHKAFISVDENGTEAAAATVVMMAEGAAMQPQEPVEVHVDHPFLFLIRDTETGTVLFMGQVINPAA